MVVFSVVLPLTLAVAPAGAANNGRFSRSAQAAPADETATTTTTTQPPTTQTTIVYRQAAPTKSPEVVYRYTYVDPPERATTTTTTAQAPAVVPDAEVATAVVETDAEPVVDGTTDDGSTTTTTALPSPLDENDSGTGSFDTVGPTAPAGDKNLSTAIWMLSLALMLAVVLMVVRMAKSVEPLGAHGRTGLLGLIEQSPLADPLRKLGSLVAVRRLRTMSTGLGQPMSDTHAPTFSRLIGVGD